MSNLILYYFLARKRFKALVLSCFLGIKFKMIGANFKIFGASYMVGQKLSVGDNCWFQAIDSYKGIKYQPKLIIGDRSAFSDGVHISVVDSIQIGQNCLFGSNIYLGDHSHGSTKRNLFQDDVPPAQRELSDIAPVFIGDNVWIGDGVIILAGSNVGNNCVIAANSVVNNTFPDFSLIAGSPAKLIRSLK